MKGIIALVVAVACSVWSSPALAHLNFLQPRLLELILTSDAVLVGRVETVKPLAGERLDSTAKPLAPLAGTTPSPLRFIGRSRLRPGGRYLLFLRKGTPFEALTSPGEVFEVDPADDTVIAGLVKQVRQSATADDQAKRRQRQVAALVPAVAAKSEALRYQAALELDRLVIGPGTLSQTQRVDLDAAAAADPVIQPILMHILSH